MDQPAQAFFAPQQARGDLEADPRAVAIGDGNAVQRLGDLAVAIAAGAGRLAMEGGVDDLGDFVVGEGLDRIVEDVPQAIGRFAIRVGRRHDDDLGPRAGAVDQADRDRPFVADRRIVEDHDRGFRLSRAAVNWAQSARRMHVAAEAAAACRPGSARWPRRDCTG